jgi:RNase P/RNase MRP subunit POP5
MESEKKLVKLFRKRYIAFRLDPARIISRRGIFTLFMKSLTEIQDHNTLDSIHLRIISYNRNTGFGILRCDHRAVEALSIALNSITKVDYEFNVEILGVSGTIKALKRKKSISIFI